MVELLHLGSLVPATVGVCCTVGARRSGRAASTASALLMLAAMLDASMGAPAVPVVVWAGILLITAVVASALARPRLVASTTSGAPPEHATAMGLHGRLGLVVMATLLLAMGSTARVSDLAVGAHHGGAVSTFGALAVVVAVGFAVFSGALAGRILQRRSAGPIRWTSAAEAACMGASVLMMALVVAT